MVRGVDARARPADRPRRSPTGSRPRARFPSTMVDRIVPATKPEDIARLAALTGVVDLSPVMHEPFRQWVVEDDFVDGARPDLGAVGVQLVEDVTPFELMKLRMLNGTHSSLAYLGYLAGHETIADTVADPAFAALRAATSGATRSSRRSRRRRARISAPTPRRSSSATPTRRSGTGPGRSPWTAARSCRSASSARIADNRAAGAPVPGPRPSRSPPGCATSAASTRRARRSTCATRWPSGCARQRRRGPPGAKVAALLALRALFLPGSDALQAPLAAAYAQPGRPRRPRVCRGPGRRRRRVSDPAAPDPAPDSCNRRHGRLRLRQVHGRRRPRRGARPALPRGRRASPASNVAKMAAGVPLDDADRWPWLDRAGRALAEGSSSPVRP